MKAKGLPTLVAVAGLALALLMTGIVYAATVLVDLFDYGNENLLVNQSTPVATAVYDGSGILGGERDSMLRWSGGTTGNIQLYIDNSNSNLFDYSSLPQMAGIITTTWDGDDNDAITLNPVGLRDGGGGVDLTDNGSNDGFLVSIAFDDLLADLTFMVYTDGSNWSQYTLRLPGAADGTPAHMDVFLPFGSFTVGGGSGATFSDVGAVVMKLDGTVAAGVDVQIDLIEASNAREYGDLPSSYSVISAYHIPQGLRLGKILDTETTYQASTNANGDDNNPTSYDDEDGVQPVLTPWPAGGTGYVEIYRYGCPSFPTGCYINGWIDWNNDGDFNDALERIVNNAQVFGDGSSYPSFSTPSSYSNSYYYARFRICTTNTACDTPGESPVTNGEVEDYRWPLGPTAVVINSFTAAPARGGIQVAWETADETDLVGFNLLRSGAEGGEFLKLNGEPIQAQYPGQPRGAAYSWLDGSVLGGVTYCYKLEVADTGGQSTLFGPVSATARYSLYLPLVLK